MEGFEVTKPFFNKIRRIPQLLFNSKLIFRRPQNVELVFFGSPQNSALIEKLFSEDYVVLDPTYNSTVHFWDLLLALLRKLFDQTSFTSLYCESFVRRLGPSKVVSFTDNNLDFYGLREKVRDMKVKFFVFQNGNRYVSQWPSKPVLGPGDAAFLLTEAYADYFRRHIAGGAQVFAIGKVHDLFEDSNSSVMPGGEKKIALISQWREKVPDFNLSGVVKPDYFSPEREYIPKALWLATTLGAELEILGAAKDLDNQATEEAAYRELLGGQGWSYSPRPPNQSNLQKIRNFELFLCFDSTLGYELLRRLGKVLFFEMSEGSGRLPLGAPKSLEHSISPLILRDNNLKNWPKQAELIMEMPVEEFRDLATGVIGADPMNINGTSLLRILESL